VLKMSRQRCRAPGPEPRIVPALMLAAPLAVPDETAGAETSDWSAGHERWAAGMTRHRHGTGPRPGLVRDARAIYQGATARGERLSQRTLARQLRGHGHRFPNEHLRPIAQIIGMAAGKAA
jgi:hypothetical protein